MPRIPTREEAWEWLCAYNESDSLRRHGLAVEGVMRHFARLAGEDEEFWGVVGLLHDLDYERYPQEHCTKVREILQEKEVDPSVRPSTPSTSSPALSTPPPLCARAAA